MRRAGLCSVLTQTCSLGSQVFLAYQCEGWGKPVPEERQLVPALSPNPSDTRQTSSLSGGERQSRRSHSPLAELPVSVLPCFLLSSTEAQLYSHQNVDVSLVSAFSTL